MEISEQVDITSNKPRELSWQLNFGSQMISFAPEIVYPDAEELENMQKYEIENKEKVKLKTVKFRSSDTKLVSIQMIYTGGFKSPLIEKKANDEGKEHEFETIDLRQEYQLGEGIVLEQQYLDLGISGFTLNGQKIGYHDVQNHNRRQLRIPYGHDVIGVKCSLDRWTGDIQNLSFLLWAPPFENML